MPPAPFASVDQVIAALEALAAADAHRGAPGPGADVVPASDHLRQTAHLLALNHRDDAELVVAGLVHDLASSLDPGCADHARRGAELVAPLLGSRVAELVGGHAEAKRYLVTTQPDYAATLSRESTATLVGQGGPMEGDELDRFEARAELAALVALRQADDQAKAPGAEVAPVRFWRPWLTRVAGD